MDDRLKKFAKLIEAGSFTEAARELHVSQPALTMAINKLERELRTSLLIRGRGRMELTEAGGIVYGAAVEHRTADDNLRTKLTDLAGARPKVTIGMIDSVAAALNDAGQPLDRLEDQADVSIIVNNSRYLREEAENREIDLAFVVSDSSRHPALDTEPLGAEPFILVCHPDRLHGFESALKAKELPDFICYDQYSTTYGHLDRGLAKLGVIIRPTLYSTNPNIMLHAALRGRGIAALPYLLTKDLVKSNKLAALKKNRRTLTISCPLSIIKARGKLLPQALEDFADQAKTTLESAAI